MTKENETYEGWSNRETWAVALHLNNSQWMYKQYLSMLEKIRKLKNESDIGLTDKQFQEYAFEHELKEWVEVMFEGFFHPTDFVRREEYNDIRLMVSDVGSLWRVNWKELAVSLMDGE